jgi:hypothetical protein
MKAVRLTTHRSMPNGKAAFQIRFPLRMSEVMRERGYTHVAIEFTDDGILLKPFTDTSDLTEMPEWS